MQLPQLEEPFGIDDVDGQCKSYTMSVRLTGRWVFWATGKKELLVRCCAGLFCCCFSSTTVETRRLGSSSVAFRNEIRHT